LAESALRVGETLRGEPLTIQPSTRDLAAAGGLPAGLAVYQLTGAGTWSVVPGQTQQAASGNAAGSIRFVPGEPGIYALLAKSPLPDAGDYPLTNGFFFRSPTDGGGFSVTDAGARFWEAYQRAGGLSALGRPTSRRFLVGAQLQQTFERGTIRADLPSGPLPGAARAAASAASATAHLGTPPPAPAAARLPEPAPLPATALPR